MTALPGAPGFGLGYPFSCSCSSVIRYAFSFQNSVAPKGGGNTEVLKP